MVRLILTLTPVVCMLSGVAFSIFFGSFLKEDERAANVESDSEDSSNDRSSNKNMYDKVYINTYILFKKINSFYNYIMFLY